MPVCLRLLIVAALVIVTSGIPTAMCAEPEGSCEQSPSDDCGGGGGGACAAFCGTCASGGVIAPAKLAALESLFRAPRLVESIPVDVTMLAKPSALGVFRPPRLS